MRPHRSSSTIGVLVLLLALLAGVAAASPATAAKGKAKKADLVTSAVTATVTNRTASVSATVTNKASKKKGKKAKASSVSFVLSSDTAAGAGDTALGSLPVKALKPKKTATVGGSLAVPATVAAGTYYVVACADAGSAVKEKKETNNCAASGAVTVAALPPTPPTGPTVTITYASATPLVGTVAGAASNGTCVPNAVTGGGTCTVSAGVGSVVLTAVPNGVPFTTFVPLAPSQCDGTVAGSTVTFTAPTTNKGCTAIFGV